MGDPLRHFPPIATAPKDGTRILVYAPHDGWRACSWSERRRDWLFHDTGDPWERGAWEEGEATHWLPLPRPNSSDIGMHAEITIMRIALETIAAIAEGSTTANSLPNIAKIARKALEL